ncbi:hypothetical protein, partial [Niallia circulans]|uniref:hypothetical protein n=1 Tax=Niallia circulans TaxID=1397 RepID=UPI001C25F3FC
ARVGRESAKLRIYQPKWRGNQANSGYISQSGEGISQTPNISAKVEVESGKLRIYQPKWRENQPNSEYISQSGGRISQTPNISAKPQPPNHTPPTLQFQPQKSTTQSKRLKWRNDSSVNHESLCRRLLL